MWYHQLRQKKSLDTCHVHTPQEALENPFFLSPKREQNAKQLHDVEAPSNVAKNCLEPATSSFVFSQFAMPLMLNEKDRGSFEEILGVEGGGIYG